MSASVPDTTPAPALSPRTVTFCVLPRDLVRLYKPLVRWASGVEDVKVVIERRGAGGDRRTSAGSAPDGVERRQGHRRKGDSLTLSQAGMELPWTLRRNADRISFVRRSVPAKLMDEAKEVDALLEDAILGDPAAIQELWLRQYDFVHGMVSVSAPPRKAAKLTDEVFAELLRGKVGIEYMQAVVEARDRVLSKP